MADLILRRSGLPAPKDWVLQLRFHESYGSTDYSDVAYLSAEKARTVLEAGAPFLLYSKDKP